MRYFAGGNTSQGFCTRFDHILPKEQQKRMFYIKGGPGVGKSSLMKAVGKAAESAGLRVEYFYCSSDPESLDGVAIPEKGAALMDGTAPHVYDPVLPGARDTLVSLGDFLDEKALRSSQEELQETQRQISARFTRCYHYLAAAAQVRKAACAGEEKPAAMRALLKEWTDVLPFGAAKAAAASCSARPSPRRDWFAAQSFPRRPAGLSFAARWAATRAA